MNALRETPEALNPASATRAMNKAISPATVQQNPMTSKLISGFRDRNRNRRSVERQSSPDRRGRYPKENGQAGKNGARNGSPAKESSGSPHSKKNVYSSGD